MFELTFYGCRGSTPISRPDVIRYGGNTTCMLINAGNKNIIIDCGTGLLNLQDYFMKKGSNTAHIFITHIHWDHIQAIAFFAPFFNKKNKFTIYGERRAEKGMREQISDILESPMFPIQVDSFQSNMKYVDIECGSSYKINDLNVDTIRLRHPNICTGYKFTYEKKSICIISDFEHGKPEDDKIYQLFADNCDILVYDSQYTEEEYPLKKGWGHSTWKKALFLAKQAHVKQLIMTHHDPLRKDLDLDILQQTVKQHMENAVFAKEGMCFKL